LFRYGFGKATARVEELPLDCIAIAVKLLHYYIGFRVYYRLLHEGAVCVKIVTPSHHSADIIVQLGHFDPVWVEVGFRYQLVSNDVKNSRA
jgi:hypothetical protein